MKADNEKKLFVNIDLLNGFIFDIDNLPKWINYVDGLDHITMNQEIKGSYVALKINLFNNEKIFHFRISEYEKNKKIRLKSNSPFFFEITIKSYQSVDGFSYIKLKTKLKPRGILHLFLTKKLRLKNKISLDILQEYCR
jgi:hypothetical protein